MVDLADIKAGARTAIHGAMSVPCLWSDTITTLPDGGPDKTKLSVRWGNKLARPQGDLDGDYMNIIEGVNRLIFRDAQLTALGITLRRGHTISIPKYGLVFELDQPETGDGPHNIYWSVTPQ